MSHEEQERRSTLLQSAEKFVQNISASGLTIYDPISVGDPNLWIPSAELEALLDTKLIGLELGDLPLRTRSKVVKEQVCRILGYPVPESFKKTQPRFVGQNFDTYSQKSRNLQIWNEEISSSRRYILIQISPEDVVTRVKVVSGDMVAKLDTTGTLTQKYQASLVPTDKTTELVAEEDTSHLKPLVNQGVKIDANTSPISYPSPDKLMPIQEIFERLSPLVGESFADVGSDQERNRGAELHRLVCKRLGYSDFKDDGRFPDVRHQLLELKLQTSPTIDLGLISPDSTDVLEIPKLNGKQIRHCDVRYALFYGKIEDGQVKLTHFFLTTGEKFFTRFTQFQGKVLNKKLQIPLPKDFFDS
ncbi:restriction endonuclease [Alicyclobacillus cycloheptanicus]|uniref:Restriction endonuclease n=1 Tax=Alicyclobacillus cycloheptanicus TaxID=1457 RepID=A0ABT9XK78_9BACL|nr:restriction endonuclease [Alicyclobacillus cycloheptanicus]MDQ0190622.1 hypothetical protein [Alicyclobacillus cycloheptanicus]WDM01823.1 restriction endonuclease [Alicyclobacillus cycloheptanicus]